MAHGADDRVEFGRELLGLLVGISREHRAQIGLRGEEAVVEVGGDRGALGSRPPDGPLDQDDLLRIHDGYWTPMRGLRS